MDHSPPTLHGDVPPTNRRAIAAWHTAPETFGHTLRADAIPPSAHMDLIALVPDRLLFVPHRLHVINGYDENCQAGHSDACHTCPQRVEWATLEGGVSAEGEVLS
jgi:hypothetical protein